MDLPEQLAAWSLAVSVVGFGLAGLTLHKGNINSSASLSLAMSEAFREAWPRYIKADDEDGKMFQLAELLNTLETGATLFHQNAFVGQSKTMQEQYLKGAFKILSEDLDVRRQVRELMDEPTTFIQARKFCEKKNIPLFRH